MLLTTFVMDSPKSVLGTPLLHGKKLAREELEAEVGLSPGLFFL